MSWITVKLLGVHHGQQDGVLVPDRDTWDFVGATVEDDPEKKRTKITFIGFGSIVGLTGVAPILVQDNPDSTHKKVAISNATTDAAGAMSAADKTKLNGIGAGANVVSVAVTAPATLGGTAQNPIVGVQASSGSQPGSMSGEHFSRVDKRLGSNPTNPATGGGLNLASAESVAARNNANSANANLTKLDSSDVAVRGDDSVVAGHDERAKTGGVWRWFINNVELLRLALDELAFGETASSPTLTVRQRTTDAATTKLRIEAQKPYASASGTNRDAGNIELSFPAPVAGGSQGSLSVSWGKTVLLRVADRTQVTSSADTAVTSFTPPSETVFDVKATFLYWKNNTDYRVAERTARFYYDGGTLNQLGTTQTPVTDDTSAGFSAVVSDLVVLAGAITGISRGIDATTIEASCVLTIAYFTP